MCRLLFNCNAELFAESLNESGVRDWYFSLSLDVQFDSLGPWTPEQDTKVTCAARKPPYEGVLRHIMSAMDSSVKRDVPYCRVLLLPLRIKVYYDEISHAGVYMIAKISQHTMPFRRQS